MPKAPSYSSLPLLKHGEFIAPEIEILGETAPNAENPEALNGVLKRFAKRKRACDNPSALGNIGVIYNDAMQLVDAASSSQMRGMGLLGLIMIVAPAIYLMPSFFRDFVAEIFAKNISYFGIATYIFITFFMCILYVDGFMLFGKWIYSPPMTNPQSLIANIVRFTVYLPLLKNTQAAGLNDFVPLNCRPLNTIGIALLQNIGQKPCSVAKRFHVAIDW